MRLMLRLPFLICLFFTFSMASAQSSKKILEETEQLLADKKYNSAFKLLMQKDPENNQPDIVIKKIEIALDYYVNSIMHQIFSFKDLESYQDIADIRGKEGTYDMYAFNIGDVLDSLIIQYPENYALFKARGDFYYEVHLIYGDQWVEYENIVLERIKKDYLKAVEKGVATYQTYFTLGYIEIKKENYKDAIPHFQKSINLNSKYAPAYYNLAYAYLYNEEGKKAIEMALKAIDLYEERQLKGDAARMIAIIHKENKDFAQAMRYYEMADEIDPENYYTLKQMLELEVQLNHIDKSYRSREAFYRLGPSNPTIYNDLLDIYLKINAEDELITFFKHKIANKKDDPLIAANLHFYLAHVYLNKKNKYEATKNFVAAKENFLKVFKPDDNIFSIIEYNLKELK